MRFYCWFIFAFLIVFMLLGCTPPSRGIVTDKAHGPAFYMTTYPCGKMTCPTLQYYPPWWSLGVETPDGKSRSVPVTELMYNQCSVGMNWRYSEIDGKIDKGCS